jgi:hypothetical protein
MDPRRWLDVPPRFQTVRGGQGGAARITVLREDQLEAGSKLRFLPFLLHGAREAVFGGPFCGGAPHALSCWARESGNRATLFYAKRDQLHPRQIAAKRNGARLEFVSPGYMTVVQKRARDYAQRAGALFLPLGFDVPAATEPFQEFLRRVRREVGSPDQVWCCAGSGMLARNIARVFTDSEICVVAVGLESRHGAQSFGPNVSMVRHRLDFAQPTKAGAPFSSDPNYDRKAWEHCAREARGTALFINVAGDPSAGIGPGAAAAAQGAQGAAGPSRAERERQGA